MKTLAQRPSVCAWWVRFGRTIDALRVIPRLLLGGYCTLVYVVTDWAMNQKDISGPDAAFVSTVVGIAPLILNFYCQNGTDWSKHDPSVPPPKPPGA